MQVTARSYLTAGVAFVGAGAIALTPVVVTPSATDVKVPAAYAVTADVALAANPIDTWMQVLQRTGANVESLAQTILAAPAPVAEQLFRNGVRYAQEFAGSLEQASGIATTALNSLPGAFETAMGQLADADVEGAVQTLLGPVYMLATSALVPVSGGIEVLRQVVDNVAEVVKVYINGFALIGTLMAVGGPVISILNVTLHTVQEAIDGALSGDFGRVADAVLNIPANFTDAVLNGFGDISVMGLSVAAPGLLTPPNPDLGGLGGGVVATVQNFREHTAMAMGWTPGQAGVMSTATALVEEAPSVEQEPSVENLPDAEAPMLMVNTNVDEQVFDKQVLNTQVDEPVTGQVDELVDEKQALPAESVGVGTETVEPAAAEPAEAAEAAEAVEALTEAKDAKAERKAAREAARAERAAARAERQAEREAARAERKAEREAARAERQQKREERRAARQAQSSDSDE